MGSCWVHVGRTWGSKGLLGRLTWYPLSSLAEEQVEIRSSFLAARKQLPVMVIVTPQDRRGSVWTQDGPSAQILQQLVSLAAEALPVLEKQLMDPRGPGDIRVRI